MGYYTIYILTQSKDRMKIVTKFGKFSHNRLPLGMGDSGYLFQVKAVNILLDIEVLKTSVDNIMVLNKDEFTEDIYYLRVIFSRMCIAGLKVNTTKCSFGFKYILYLGYIITQEGVKHNPKKYQRIIYIIWHTTVQWYMDMWTRRSHVVDPLPEAYITPKVNPLL